MPRASRPPESHDLLGLTAIRPSRAAPGLHPDFDRSTSRCGGTQAPLDDRVGRLWVGTLPGVLPWTILAVRGPQTWVQIPAWPLDVSIIVPRVGVNRSKDAVGGSIVEVSPQLHRDRVRLRDAGEVRDLVPFPHFVGHRTARFMHRAEQALRFGPYRALSATIIPGSQETWSGAWATTTALNAVVPSRPSIGGADGPFPGALATRRAPVWATEFGSLPLALPARMPCSDLGNGAAAGNRDNSRSVWLARPAMATREVAAEFDRISEVYDETRDPLDPSTVGALAESLHLAGVTSVLEVGVGTGRVAIPLGERGLEVTGLDASRGMLARARSKGLVRLLRGSALHLPLGDGAFDAILFVHVLHVLDDPLAALREATRVGRVGAFALVHPQGDPGRVSSRREDEPRRLLREILVEQGYPMPVRSSLSEKERDLMASFPPDSTRVLGEKDVTESLRSRIDRLAKRGHRNLLDIPPDALAKAIATARERVGERTVTYHRVEALATWYSPRGVTRSTP